MTELGVDRIVPLRSARSVVRWQGDRAVRAVARLRRVATEAAAQSRRTWLPEVTEVKSLDGLAALSAPVESSPALRRSGGVALAHPGGGPPSLGCPVVAIGPEGGWDGGELARFGVGPGLGPTVLRAETAAIAMATILCALRSGTVATLA